MATSIHDILRELRAASENERDKGDRFERLMQAYLSTEPQYRALYSDVWMWRDYPDRHGRRDTGIDLVARDRVTGELTAIQCKFYAPEHTLAKGDIDSFLAASSKAEFAGRMIISTTDLWGGNAEDAVEGQHPPVQRLRVQDLDDSSIDWSRFSLSRPGELTPKPHKQPFPHQRAAIERVVAGFQDADRGKLIMACGTGKTFTALRIAEALVPPGGTVLFLVPSISLLSQTLKEWTIEAEVPLRSFAVCSDSSVGKRSTDEDIPVTDLAFPATTNTAKLVKRFADIPRHAAGITVVFSTYQSIDVVAQAQAEAGPSRSGIPEFDLVVCDEAHRTTGVTLAAGDESAFVRVHDAGYLRARQRLYMTATPRIYADTSRAKAEEAGAVVADMNDASLYGEEFHRLGFGEAVSIGRLTDYKVLVLAVDESYVSTRFQRLLADDDNELKLDDAAKIVGCWNGLSKRSLTADEFALDPLPMKRAVAFAKNIAESKKIARMFAQVVDAEIDALGREGDEDADDLLDCEVHHVDGTYNVLERNRQLDWLKQDPGPNAARILTNAKCLSEGVDVPALDAVMFLNPRDSVVDVVQSVGRVMRKLEGKNYGYVILPIGVPADMDPATALNDNRKYKVVWQVLQALRAHDERFDAEVNKIDLTGTTGRLSVGVIGKGGGSRDGDTEHGGVQLDFPDVAQWRDAILAKIVQKVGERRYWENWAKHVAGIARTHMTRIGALVEGADAALRDEFLAFLRGLQDNLNPWISERDAIEMLSQHLITRPVFDALFEGYAFSEQNPVSRVMQRMVDALEGQNLQKETESLERFYESVRTRAAGITDAGAKQSIVKELYERFFATAFAGTSDRLGIVYTPNEIVDFIIRSVDDALRTEFGASLSDRGVHVLDPFTGTGTFLVRLLQSGLIRPEDLAHKYRHELHANEIVLLAYYVAAINIEETYHALAGGEYEPFDGIALTDTFQLNERDDRDELPGFEVFAANNERVRAQKARDIRVIIGNPPYSVGQTSANDDNPNLRYPSLDRRIAETYAAESSANLKSKLYDSYVRAIRWASDRIGERGVVSFVSNGGFIDSNSADGLRKVLVEEFSSLYVFNLRGNARTSGELRRKERDSVFGQGSRTTVAISLLIKNPDAAPGGLHYRDVGDYLTREQKLDAVRDAGSYTGVPWQRITPNAEGDWINQRTADFEGYQRIEDVFSLISYGVNTGRDAWVYQSSRAGLASNMRRSISTFNAEVERWKQNPLRDSSERALSRWVDRDSHEISWSSNLMRSIPRGNRSAYISARVVQSAYRPFFKQHLYFDSLWNSRTGANSELFPPDGRNKLIYVVGMSSEVPFTPLMVDAIPNLHLTGAGSGGATFPRYSFEQAADGELRSPDDDGTAAGTPGLRRIDNVTDEALAEHRIRYGDNVTADDVFFSLYGILHSPEYRERYAADLKKMLPRIPAVRGFRAFADAGRALADLHLGYESADPYPLHEQRAASASYRVEKMR